MSTASAGTRARNVQQFFLDWLPFVGLVAVYEGLRDLVPMIGAPRHDFSWIDIAVFGGELPTNWLQSHFHKPNTIGWEDTLATATYFLYYLVPVAVGLVWWIRSRHIFRRYAAALLTLCALAFITYVALPTIPPWLAHPTSIYEITDATIIGWNLPHAIVAIYLGHDYNLYAAFPSLHAAFPVVLTYYGWLRSRALGLAMLFYACLVWLSVVFLGEHYVIDIVGGVIYASAAVLSVETMQRLLTRPSRAYLKARPAGGL